ncbi:MAG: response regulator [Chloroflexi bacterium]|nr:response regulator [Chloroflexota bacterium]
MRILVVDDDLVTLTWLKQVLEREGYAVSTANRGALALEQIAKDRPDLVVLDLVLPDMDGMDVLRRLRQDPAARDLWVVVLSAKGRPEDIVAGLRGGADDYVPKRPGADVELTSKIRGLFALAKRTAPEPEAAPAPEGAAKVFSFCSAKGGTGTTVVCVNTCYALAQLAPRAQVLLVDMVFPIGTVGQSIGYESRDTVARLTQRVHGKLDRALIEKYVSPVQRWGFRVLLGACDPQEATLLDVGQIGPLFEQLRTMYDYIFVDFGRTLSRISLPIIQNSESIVVILTPDVNTVKLTRLTLDYLEALGVKQNQVILINNRTVGRVWVSKEETEHALNVPLSGTIPYESEYLTMAINSGVPFAAKFPQNAASLMFADFARLLRDRSGR